MRRFPQINGALHREPEQRPISTELFVGPGLCMGPVVFAAVSSQVNIAL